MRSVPEKTLENWASIYLSSVFPDAALWWPASGEDVAIDLLRLATSGEGTTLALELKTTEALGQRHYVQIDVEQLKRYLSAEWPMPVYYAFPLPRWTGSLHPSRVPPPLPNSSREPSGWWRPDANQSWFGEWLYVLSAQAVSEALRADWQSKQHVKLFSLTRPHNGTDPDWAALLSRTPPAKPVKWKDFWSDLRELRPNHGTLWRTEVGDTQIEHRFEYITSRQVGRIDLDSILEELDETRYSQPNPGGRSSRIAVRIPPTRRK